MAGNGADPVRAAMQRAVAAPKPQPAAAQPATTVPTPAPVAAPTGNLNDLAGVQMSSQARVVEDKTSLFDRMWTDDFAALPVVGPIAEKTGVAYQTSLDTVNWGVSGALLAANPHYWANRGQQDNLWQTATEVSAGQAFQGAINPLQSAIGGGIYDGWASFNIANRADRDLIFAGGTASGVGSGIADGLVTWFLDPTVLLGKGVKVARFGSELLGVTGLTQRSTNLTANIDRVTWMADEALQHIDAGTVAPKGNTLFVQAHAAAKKTYTEMLDEHWTQGTWQDTLSHIAGTLDNARDEAIFMAAAAGSPKYIAMLRAEHTAVADALNTAQRATDHGLAMITKRDASSWIPKAILDDVEDQVIKASPLLDDLIRKDAALRDALGIVGEGAAPIESLGGSSAKGMALMAAWRAGKSQRDLPKGARGTWLGREAAPAITAAELNPNLGGSAAIKARIAAGVDLVGGDARVYDNMMNGSLPGVYERVYQMSSNFRKVRLWSWASGQRGSGYVAIRGMEEGYSSSEITASMTDSRVIRKDPEFLKLLQELWGRGSNSTDRMRLLNYIETLAVKKIADHYGVSYKDAMAAYAAIDASRARMIASLRSRKGHAYGINPEDDSIILLDPVLRSQLETAVPMLDMRVMENTIKRMSRPEFRDIGDNLSLVLSGRIPEKDAHLAYQVADEINSMWKASVLLRLGYTQRNVLEGWLRTWAVLGTVPILMPKAAVKGLYRTAVSNPRAARVTASADKHLGLIGEEIGRARGVVRLHQAELDRINALDHSDQAIMAQYRDAQAQLAAAQAHVDDLLQQADLVMSTKAKYGRKRVFGDTGAYSGNLGHMYRGMASNQKTVDNFYMTALDRDKTRLVDENSWVKVQPNDPQYWSELAQASEQFRSDPMARRALAGDSVPDLVKWADSPEGTSYFRDLGIRSRTARHERAALIYDQVNRYLPTAGARRAASMDSASGAMLKAELGGFDALSPIHGREVLEAVNKELTAGEAYRGFLQWAFKWLGSIPESSLVRQPFYATVWQRESTALFKRAEQLGLDVADEAVQARITQAAHRRALKATNETLFTITRYSNPAAALKFLSPFFAAWENSMRTWTGIIYRDPSVLARANMLWDLPNKLGMVVDQDGNKVKTDPMGFLSGSQGQFIVLPKFLNDWVMERNGGVPLKFAKGAMNVVSPGEVPWLPGLGPAVTAPMGWYLESRPDEQEFLKRVLGKDVYSQIVPFERASSDLSDTVLSAAGRKAWQLALGEESPDYVAVMGAITLSEIVDWQKRGGKIEDRPSPEDIKAKADSFYLFGIATSLTSPVAMTRMSKYQVEIDYWNTLKADPTMTFQAKLDTFRAKFGDDYMALTMSTSKNLAAGLDPTMQVFNALDEFAPQIEFLTTSLGREPDPAAVGPLLVTVPDGKFNAGVYNYLLTQEMPGTDEIYRQKKAPGSLVAEATVNEMLNDYYRMRDLRDEALSAYGLSPSSLRGKTAQAAGIPQKWDEYVNGMASKYKELWTANQPGATNNKFGLYLASMVHLTRDDKFMSSELGKSPVWQTVADYLKNRDLAMQALAAGTPKENVLAKWGTYTESIRHSSLKFSDLYDQYLSDDDLTVRVG